MADSAAQPRPQRPLKKVSEATRERETFRYDPFLTSKYPVHDGDRPIADENLKTSSHSVLTALAQLGLYQTGTVRAFVSLFDKTYQYVIAEATRAIPLTPDVPNRLCPDPLLLCGHAVPRGEGVCEKVLAALDEDPAAADPHELPVTVVSDLAADESTAATPYCQPQHGLQFYAAVPIRTLRGINIGTYSVRGPLTEAVWGEAEMRSLKEISRGIMEHLEGNRDKYAYRRNERVSRGLGSFIEAKSTLSGWRYGPNVEAFQDDTVTEGRLDAQQQHLEEQAEGYFDQPPDSDVSSPAVQPGPIPHHPKVPPSPNSPIQWRSVPSQITSPPLSSVDAARDVGIPTSHVVDSAQDSPHVTLEEKRAALYSRAANIIREAFEVEGCIYLDVTLGSYRTRTAKTSQDADDSRKQSQETTSSSSSDEQSLSSPVEDPNTPCGVLGFSTSQRSSINASEVAQDELLLSKRFLAKLLRRYPNGKIFNFGASGELQSSDSSDEGPSDDHSSKDSAQESEQATARQSKSASKQSSRREEANIIYETFKKARSVIFIPLWDSKRERWFAGNFIYTQNSSRVFTVEGELSLLKAFSHLIATEFYTLDTMQSNQAKSDALGSLSHELRSPLHGVILGTELLNDTDLTVFQGDAIHTIETCCRTLLDTLDHLLDYAKVNSLASDRDGSSSKTARTRRRRANTDTFGKKSLYSNVRLDSLVEEVVESVFAGFNFQHMSVKQLSRKQSVAQTKTADDGGHGFMDTAQAVEQLVTPSTESGDDSMDAQLSSVSVCVQVDPTCDWLFQLPSGAIRRIVMNLFGNALKFTSKGSIWVMLGQETSRSKLGRAKRLVKLTVQDSGKGMSSDYIRHHLFRPFAQEDALSPGTGLGLSLVKAIVSSLQGQIRVESQKSLGTRITVTLPLEPSLPDAEPSEDDEAFREHTNELRGLRVRLIGFEGQDQGQEKRQSMVEEMCRETLGLEVVPQEQSGDRDMSPEVVLWMESAVPATLDGIGSYAKTPNVVICSDALSAYERISTQESWGHGGIFEFTSQPIGPRKIAKSIYSAYRRWVGLKKPTGGFNASVASRNSPDIHEDGAASNPPPSSSSSLMTIQADAGTTTSTTASVLSTPSKPDRRVDEAPPENSVLLADDNRINLKVLSAFMGKLKRSFVLATNGKEALDLYVKSPDRFAGIIMDISMPVMDGFEATRQIRKAEHQQDLKATPIVALTGLASHEAQQEALESGVNTFLTKPVRFNQLEEVLGKLGV